MMENKNRTYLEAADIYEPTDLVHNNKDGSKYKEKDNEPLDAIKGNPDDIITMSHVDIGFKRGTDLRVVVEDFSLAIQRKWKNHSRKIDNAHHSYFKRKN